jgi:hypothetical protein
LKPTAEDDREAYLALLAYDEAIRAQPSVEEANNALQQLGEMFDALSYDGGA